MDKFCVFCGNKPEHKTYEHVLPQWLIGLTGEPTRTARFGRRWEGESENERVFSFNAFKFPSCEPCNATFSALEAGAKPTVSKILAEGDVSATEFNVLLDWFDKVRIGLWLAFIYLDGNPVGVKPHFYMAARIGRHDRMLVVFRMDHHERGLNVAGCDTLFFRHVPSCFTLRINNYVFLNISYPHLVSRRIGFPYPITSSLLEDERLKCRMSAGRNRVRMPLLRKAFSLLGTELYQPMFPEVTSVVEASQHYDVPYVKARSLSWEQGVGKIFLSRGRSLKEYPDSPSKLWMPVCTYRPDVLLFEAQILALEFQNFLIGIAPSFDALPSGKKAKWKSDCTLFKRYNDRVIEALREKAVKLGIPPPHAI